MSQKFFTYKEAKTYLKKIPVASKKQYMEWIKGSLKARGLPKFNKRLPKRPDRVYRKEWKSWIAFLSKWSQEKRKMIKESHMLTYEEAKAYLKKIRIGHNRKFTQEVYNKWSNEGFALLYFPKKSLPKDPSSFYKGKGWKGWNDFLPKIKAQPHPHPMNWYRACKWIRKANKGKKLKTAKDFKDYVKASYDSYPVKIISQGRFKGLKAISLKIPKEPRIYYKRYWENWKHFLLKKEEGSHSLKHMSYKDAKRFLKKIGLKSFRTWRRYRDLSELATKKNLAKARKGQFKGKLVFRSGEFKGKPIKPKKIPKAPHYTYPEWEDWLKFLGNK